jgi:hypothetical protein
MMSDIVDQLRNREGFALEGPRRLMMACEEAAAEIARLRAELAQKREWERESNHLYRSINGMDIDDFDKRAEYVVQTRLDGLSIGSTNRHSVKALLAEHFADIASSAARQNAEEIARLREALTEIGREQSAVSATVAADKFQSLARAALAPRPPKGKGE